MIAFHASHSDRTVPICSKCKMQHGSIKTPSGMLCASYWMERLNKRKDEGPKKKARKP
jgi:hypothetical protein